MRNIVLWFTSFVYSSSVGFLKYTQQSRLLSNNNCSQDIEYLDVVSPFVVVVVCKTTLVIIVIFSFDEYLKDYVLTWLEIFVRLIYKMILLFVFHVPGQMVISNGRYQRWLQWLTAGLRGRVCWRELDRQVHHHDVEQCASRLLQDQNQEMYSRQ